MSRELLELLDQEDGPTPAAEARLRARLKQPRRPPLWVPALVLAALALLFLLRPEPEPEPPRALQVELGDQAVQPMEALSLQPRGAGELSGTERDVRIAWEAGRLEVELDPEAEVALQVQTREGTVVVTGTVFSVERSALGTEVELRRGSVELTCVGQAPRPLRPDEAFTCPPTTGPGMLNRALHLDQQGAPREEVLSNLDQALQLAPAGHPVRGEILAMTADLRALEGDVAGAAQAAQQYLDEGYTMRAEELRRRFL